MPRGVQRHGSGSLILISTLTWIIGATLVSGALSLLVAAAIAFTLLRSWTSRLVSFAAGTLLGAAFLDLMPEAFDSQAQERGLFTAVLAGILAFFVLEKVALWRRRHAPASERMSGKGGTLILVGDSVHNFIDGILIAAAFLTNQSVGIATSLAIAAHEIPQEIGDFAVLLTSGYSRRRALVFNFLSSLTSVAGGLVGYFTLARVESAVPYVLAFAAASFIYIALADLFPDLHRTIDTRGAALQFLLIGIGVATIAMTHAFLQ